MLWKYAHFWTDHVIIKFGIEYNMWSPSKNLLFTNITLNFFYAQEHQKGQETVLFMYSSRRGGYKLLGLSFCQNIETHPLSIVDYTHSVTRKKFRHELSVNFGTLVMFDIPMILAIHAVKFSYAPLPAHLSATTMLATIGYGCFMKPSSTTRHEMTFSNRVPPANMRSCQN